MWAVEFRAVLGSPRDRLALALGLVALFLATAAVTAYLVRFPGGPSVGFDSAASVLHFERLVSGRQLEGFVTTTPKPVLTVVFGGLHAVGGWFAIEVATIAVFAGAVTLAAWLVFRLAGPAGGAFAATALVGSPLLLVDVGNSYAVAWALLLWLVAGTAVGMPQPRYGVAGLALLAAALVRLETLVVVPGAIAAFVLARFVVHRSDPWVVPWRALAVAVIPLLAIPVMAIHDWLLTGDPLFWASVSTRYAEAAAVRGFRGLNEVRDQLLDRYAGQLAYLLLGGVAAAGLWRARQWPLVVGVVTLAAGTVAFLILLAARGLFVSTRYMAAIDVTIVFAAGIGLGGLRWQGLGSDAGKPWSSVMGSPFKAVAGGLVAVSLSAWSLPLAQLSNDARFQRNMATAVPIVQRALDAIPGAREPVPGSTWRHPVPVSQIVVFVPSPSRPRLAVDLGLPLSKIAGIAAGAPETPTPGIPRPGQIFIHDRRSDLPASRYTFLEIASPTRVRDVELVPLLADVQRGLWVIEVRSPA